MPRPGLRPYECVRRAWHSDRHNPIRGSLIQEIFRIANEVHSPSTRKNREWQEKLPIVVLRAEEILYSKASCEAEYTDLTTLWDRVNDAIDTIIRKDESTENGTLLQPCIEAALHLGCTPRRSSRSQRNDSPICYLRHQMLEPMPVLTSNSDAKAFKNLMPNSSTNQPLRSSHSLPRSSFNSSISRFKASNHNMKSRNFNEHHLPGGSYSPTWSVYPLYYNDKKDSQLDGSKLSSSRPCPGTSPYRRPSNEAVVQQNFLSSSEVALIASTTNHEHMMLGISHEVNCDLTLRLGPVVHSRASVEDHQALQVKPRAFQERKLEKFLRR